MSKRILRFALAFFGVLVATSIHAQSKVATITVNGASQTCAQGIWVAGPKTPAGKPEVCVQHEFPPGTTLEMPAGTSMKIYNISATENVVTLMPFSKTRISASAKGESYTAFFGKALFSIKKRLSFFTVSDPSGKIQAAAKGTVFSSNVDNKNIRYEKIQGAIQVSRAVKLKIGNAQASDDKKRKRVLDTTKYEELVDDTSDVTYALDIYETDWVPFDTFDDASRFFSQMIEQRQYDIDPEELADIYSTLGQLHLEEGRPREALDLFDKALAINIELSPDRFDVVFVDNYTDIGYAWLDMNQPEEAIKYFDAAAQLQAAIDPWDPFLAESLLDLSDAYFEANDDDNSDAASIAAIELLNEIIAVDIEDFNLAVQEGDAELATLIALDIGNNYEIMAFAYENLDDEESADMYFDRAEDIFDEYDSYDNY